MRALVLGFLKLDVDVHNGAEELILKGGFDAVEHFKGMPQARVKIGNQDAVRDAMAKPVFDQVDNLKELAQALQGKPAGLDRDDYFIRGPDSVDGKNP